MRTVGQDPAAEKIKHYFDPNSLEDLTACVPLYLLCTELRESHEGAISDTRSIVGRLMSPDQEYLLRSCVEDRTAYQGMLSVALSMFEDLDPVSKADLADCLRDRKLEIDYFLDKIDERKQPLIQEEPETVAEPSFALPALLTNNPAAEYLVALIKDSGLTGGDAALGFGQV